MRLGKLGRDTETAPVICGLKGMLYVELHAKGPAYDAHSGLGGVVPNPAWRLVMALATLRDERGLRVDGLDDLVVPPSQADSDAAAAAPFDEEGILKVYGLTGWQRGLKGREVQRAEMFEPTANIAGFTSGYSGEGAKTIVPSTATVKMDSPRAQPDARANAYATARAPRPPGLQRRGDSQAGRPPSRQDPG